MTVKLPVIGSSAPDTSYIAVDILAGDCVLHIDGNSKVTVGNGSYAEPAPNAFSIVNGADCPFRTPTCEASCYVQGIEEHAGALYQLYKRNSETIRAILPDARRSSAAAAYLGRWISEHAAGGFRWHVSGDIFSISYAHWISMVVRLSPDVPHWIYTRSFPHLTPLLPLSTTRGGNLAINLSCDRDNMWLARRYAEEHGLRLCYLVDDSGVVPDLPAGSVLFPDYSLRARGLADAQDSPWWQGLTVAQRQMVCPVDFFGKSESMRCGPCKKCLR